MRVLRLVASVKPLSMPVTCSRIRAALALASSSLDKREALSSPPVTFILKRLAALIVI